MSTKSNGNCTAFEFVTMRIVKFTSCKVVKLCKNKFIEPARHLPLLHRSCF
jgi:hypothetical protein